MKSLLYVFFGYIAAAILSDPVAFDLRETEWTNIWTYFWILFGLPIGFLIAACVGGLVALLMNR